MVGGCMECKKWEEEVYWSRFQTLHFCQFLSGRFFQQIAIPEKFAKNLREKMGESVALKGPSGHVWEVGLATNGDTLLIKDGWKEFVEDHSLQENDILIFNYNRNSGFDVLMFDQDSLCEKALSYFVKKCKHTESGCGSRQGRRRSERVFNDSEQSADFEVDDAPLEKRPRAEAGRMPPTSKQTLWLGKRPRAEAGRMPPTSKQALRFSVRGPRGGGGCGLSPRTFQLKSRRRGVSSEEKEKAQQRAKAEASDTNFVVVMRASHVSSGFFMSIPAEWAKNYLPRSCKEVELRTNGNTWKAKYLHRGYTSGLTGGWKNFVMENFLEELDVCVFDPVAGIKDTIVLEVKIFRVVEEVIPPSLVLPPRSSSGNRRQSTVLTIHST